MFETALNHIPLAVAFVAILILHLFRLEVRLTAVSRQHSPTKRPRFPFGNREMNGEMVLVDPDGRITRSRRR